LDLGEVFPIFFIILISYLIGSIPTAFLAGKWIKGIDLRHYGSGTISGSMVFEHVAKWVIIPVGIFDILKGSIAALLGIKLTGEPLLAAFAGLAAVIGHNWPVFLNFTGGRGLSPFMGVLLVLFPPGVLWMLAFLAIGYLLGDSAPWSLVSLASLPILNKFLNGLAIINLSAIAIILITLIKRLEANRRPLPQDGIERKRVILLRLLFDRDIQNHKEWINRVP
jgi:glycerol-3-phosphate acyltransferase PlsY